MFGGPAGFLCMRLSGSMTSSIALCDSMSIGTHVLKDGKVLRVCADCKLYYVFIGGDGIR